MTHQKIRKTCNQALSFIRSQQQPNGGFLSNEGNPTTFYTSLILSNSSVKDDALKASGGAFLLNEKSDSGTFNYWQRSSAEHAGTPYPDDLDDTFVAMQALHACTPESVTEEVFANLVTLLIAQETNPGGPYKTWVTNDKNAEDIDIVVNSNIAALLSQYDVHLPQLQEYFDQQLTNNSIHSKYYHDEITILYFLTRAYTGEQKELLIQKLFSMQNKKGTWGSALHTAFAVLSLISLGIPKDRLELAIAFILNEHDNGTWPATPLYIDRIENGIRQYSSCDAYTSAVCMEALLAYDGVNDIAPDHTEEQLFIKDVHLTCMTVTSDPILSTQLSAALKKLSLKDPASEIALLPYHFALQSGQAQKLSLSAANTLGWIGYSIYDGILDGEDKTALLPLANCCIKAMINIFKDTATVHQYEAVQRILDGIDASTAWEHASCRHDGSVPSGLPDYTDYSILAAKSLGHAIGPILLCTDTKQAVLVERFFTHYLIARQLNDDAHDWQEDLQNGFINSVSVDMIKELQTMDMPVLQEYFWDTQIDQAAALILQHASLARDILKKVTVLKEVTFLASLLTPLEQSATMALTERDKSKRFLNALH